MTGHEILGGRYELRGVLGSGGMAEVREAFDTLLRRPVAVKMLHPNLDDPEYHGRFTQEARAAAALEHPNIVAVHDFSEHEGRPFIVMERLPGTTLGDLMARGPMTPLQVRAMLDDVLSALGAAHRAGVLHRDVKPGNILLSATGDALKVADFGIAKTADAVNHTQTGQIIGTMCYLSPERLAGAPASVADDLYAVGIIAYEALLGRRAFPQDHPVAVAHAIVNAPPPPLSYCRPDVDPGLASVVERAMARDPAHRFSSADEMRAALTGPVPVTAPPQTRVMPAPLPPPTGNRPVPVRNQTRTWVLVGGIATAFLVAGIALAMQPFSSSPAPAQPVGTSSAVPAPPPPPTTTPSAPPVVQPVESAPPGPPAAKPGKPNKPGKAEKKGPGNGRGGSNGR